MSRTSTLAVARASRRAPPASPRVRRGQVVVRRLREGQRRAQVLDDDVDDALLQRRGHHLARSRPRAARTPAARGGAHPRRRPRPGSGSPGSRTRRTGSSPPARRCPAPPARRRPARSSSRRTPSSPGYRRRTADSSRAGTRAKATVAPRGGEKGIVKPPAQRGAFGDMASLPQAPPDPGPAVPVERPAPPAIQRVRSPAASLRRTPAAAAAPQRLREVVAGAQRAGPDGLGGRRRHGHGQRVRPRRHPRPAGISEIRSPGLTSVAEVAGVLATRRGDPRDLAEQPRPARRLPAVAAPVRLDRRRPASWSTSARPWPTRCSGRGPTRSRSSAAGRASRCRRCR